MEEIQSSNQITFYCEADATSRLDRLKALPSSYYCVDGQVTEVPVYARGRPSKSGPRKIMKRHWQIKTAILEKTATVAKKREEAGCFVLLTNRPKEGDDTQTAKDLLCSYKAQDGIERNYNFLKDPLIAGDLFLKKPGRPVPLQNGDRSPWHDPAHLPPHLEPNAEIHAYLRAKDRNHP